MQKKIYQSLGGTKELDRKVWETFVDKVGWDKGGWRKGGKSAHYHHYEGYLPTPIGLPQSILTGTDTVVVGLDLFSRAETCRL